MIPEILVVSLGLAAFALLTTAALSPLETLSWWAGWTEEEIDKTALRSDAECTAQRALFVVYLSGVASISGKFILRREEVFVRGLRTQAPNAIIIDDVFPYSPSGLPLLASPRAFDRLWRWIQKLDLQGRRTMLRELINLRNIYQVLVSADHRYGPIFSQGAASAIETSLLKAGYAPGAGARIVIIGYSGGAQVAVGAAPFLKARLDAPIDVISVGGVLASDRGIDAIDALHHVHGDRDRIEKIGAVMFAERWSAFANSRWNAAKRDGRIIFHRLDDIIHAGPNGYFGLPRRKDKSNNERTQEIVVGILSARGP